MCRITGAIWLALAAPLAVAGCAIDPAEDAGDIHEAQARADLTAGKPAGGGHCVMSVDTGKQSCFSTFTEAFAMATGGRIIDAPDNAHAALADPAFMARVGSLPPDQATKNDIAGDGTTPLGTYFPDAGWQGDDDLTFVSTRQCNSSMPIPITAMPSGWNDEISSFSNFPHCFSILYADGGFRGRHTALAANLLYVGDDMNDQTSTIMFY